MVSTSLLRLTFIGPIHGLTLFVAGLILVGCTSRAEIIYLPEAAAIGSVERVFVGTTRVLEDGVFTAQRQRNLGYSRVDVSVPPDREDGEVTLGNRRPTAQRNFAITQAVGFPSRSEFQTALRQELASKPADQRDVVVYIHGYNTTFAESIYRIAQMRHDFDLPGVPIHYAWPSAGTPAGYVQDRDSVLFARDGLEDFLIQLSNAGASDVILIAHSMGAQLTMEALRTFAVGGRRDVIESIGGVILLSPDIDIDVFRSQAQRIGQLPQPFAIFTSSRDRALELSARISGQGQRLGNVGTAEDVADLQVTLIDVSQFDGGVGDSLNHSTAVTSPAAIELIRQLPRINASFQEDPASQLGLISQSVLTVRNATQVILAPVN